MQAKKIHTLRNIHDLTSQERKTFMRQKFMRKSRFEQEFAGKNQIELACGNHAQLLRDEVIRLLALKNVDVVAGELEHLHKTIAPELKDYGFDDGVNKVTALLYDTDDAFTSAYHAFIKEQIQAFFPYPFYFQATPTIRIHCPDGKNADHYPRYHCDINYGHPPEEINIWLPLTSPIQPQYHGFRLTNLAFTRQILEKFDYNFEPFIESAIHDKPFNHAISEHAPQVTTELGKMIAFDSRCIHTGEPLLHHTRASMDIRIIPVADFETLEVEYQGTGRRKIRYVPNHAYYSLSSEKL